MVIAVTDHGNSGITMGNANTTSTYSNTPVSAYIDPLKKAKMTVEGALSQLKEDKSNIVEVAALYGLDDLSPDELTTLQLAKDPGEEMVKCLPTVLILALQPVDILATMCFILIWAIYNYRPCRKHRFGTCDGEVYGLRFK